MEAGAAARRFSAYCAPGADGLSFFFIVLLEGIRYT